MPRDLNDVIDNHRQLRKIPAHTTLMQACQIMTDNHVSELAVIDEAGFCGILSEATAIQCFDAQGAPSEQVPVATVMHRRGAQLKH